MKDGRTLPVSTRYQKGGMTQMAIKKVCPECGTHVSDQARNCPNCGYPLMDYVYHSIESNPS